MESGQMKMEDRKGYEDMKFNFQGKTSVTESNQINITKYGQNGIKEPQMENHKILSILRIW